MILKEIASLINQDFIQSLTDLYRDTKPVKDKIIVI